MDCFCLTAKSTLIYIFLQHDIGFWPHEMLHQVLHTWACAGAEVSLSGVGHLPLACNDTEGTAVGCCPCSAVTPAYWQQSESGRVLGKLLDREEERFLGVWRKRKERFFWLPLICLEGNHHPFLACLLLPTFWPFHCSSAPRQRVGREKERRQNLNSSIRGANSWLSHQAKCLDTLLDYFELFS